MSEPLPVLPIEPLPYAPPESTLGRVILLWLVMAHPAAIIFAATAHAVAYGSSLMGIHLWVGLNVSQMAGEFLGVLPCTWLICAAIIARKSGRLRQTELACGVVAGMHFFVGLSLVIAGSFLAMTKSGLPAMYQPVYVVNSAISLVASLFVPVTSWLAVRFYRRLRPDTEA